jgi:hypothetical protein
MSINIIIRIFCAVGKASSFIFLSVGIERWQKINVLDCALAFLVQMLNFSTIFALCTTCYMCTKAALIPLVFSGYVNVRCFLPYAL